MGVSWGVERGQGRGRRRIGGLLTCQDSECSFARCFGSKKIKSAAREDWYLSLLTCRNPLPRGKRPQSHRPEDHGM